MKRIFLALILAVVLGACGQSSTDVGTGGRGGGGGNGDPFVPPDTVIKSENAVVDLYRPGNPVALGTVHSLTARSSFTDAIGAAAALGYALDPASTAVAVGSSADGRDVVISFGALAGADRAGHVLYLRVGEREHALALRVAERDGDGIDVLELADKREAGPQGMPWFYGDLSDCLMRAVSDVMTCRWDCETCYLTCVYSALVRIVLCIIFHMI